jgi:hypothetical protein
MMAALSFGVYECQRSAIYLELSVAHFKILILFIIANSATPIARQLPATNIFVRHEAWNFKMSQQVRSRTWQSNVGANLFRWAGRTPGCCLPSGMDDCCHPRAPVLTDMEAHLDSQVWMIVSTRSITKVAKVVNKTEDALSRKELTNHPMSTARSFLGQGP